MERDAETTTHRRDEDRGGGGKLRRPPTRKPPSTPYARPPSRAARAGDEQPSRWLSKLVDPARRLISGGASLFFPSFFSDPPPLEDCDDHDTQERIEVQHDASVDDQNCTVNREIPRIIGVEGPSRAVDVSETASDLVWQKQDSKDDKPDEKKLSEPVEEGISDIEVLLKGKNFSRDEVNRLVDIINSRAVEAPNTEQEKKYQSISVGEPKVPVTNRETIDITSEKKQTDSHGSLWKASTPLHQSVMLDEVAASPIDIAKAYMGSRRESGNFSKAMIPRDDRSLLYSPDFGSKLTIPSPLAKPSAHWPGSMVQDQRDYLTPQPQRGRYGLHNFPRTPYSRTIFSKSKSKVSPQLQGDTDKWLRPSSSMQKMETPIFGQEKSRAEQLEGDYASVGPIRRSRHRLGSQTPFNSSGFISSSSVGPSKVEQSKFSQGFLPAVKKNFETGASSSSSQFQSADRKNRGFEPGVPTVHPQTSRIARTILEHLDRNPPTPKEKLEELKLATAWKKSISSTTPSLINPNDQQKSAQEKSDKSISIFGSPSQENMVKTVEGESDPPRSDVFLSNGREGISQAKSSHEAPNLRKKPPTSGNKPVLPSIFIDKPVSSWKFSLDQNSGFTFPVSTASGALSEPPTPSIMPSLSASSQQQPKDGLFDVPTYTFGSTKSEPALVFSFPSTSGSGVQSDSSEIKFSFGSDKPRLSFSSPGKNAICY